MKVQGEKCFSVPTSSFGISAAESDYTLQYSADGVTFTAYDGTVPAGEVEIVTNAPKGMIYRLSGNTGEVFIQY